MSKDCTNNGSSDAMIADIVTGLVSYVIEIKESYAGLFSVISVQFIKPINRFELLFKYIFYILPHGGF